VQTFVAANRSTAAAPPHLPDFLRRTFVFSSVLAGEQGEQPQVRA
jgi:hypothetical protein